MGVFCILDHKMSLQRRVHTVPAGTRVDYCPAQNSVPSWLVVPATTYDMNLNLDLHLGFPVSIAHNNVCPSPLFPWVVGKSLWLSSSWTVLSLSCLYFLGSKITCPVCVQYTSTFLH